MGRGKISKDLVSTLNNLYPDLGLVGKLLKEAHQGKGTATRKLLSCSFVSNALAAEGLTGSNTGTHGVAPAVALGKCKLELASTSTGMSRIDTADNLGFDIDDKIFIEGRVKFVRDAAAASKLFFGLCSTSHATDVASSSHHAVFCITDSGTATTLTIYSKDGSTTNSAIASGITVANDTYYTFKIDLSNKSDVKFYVDNKLCPIKTIDMSAYASNLQPIVQLQKGAVTTSSTAYVDYLRVESDRA